MLMNRTTPASKRTGRVVRRCAILCMVALTALVVAGFQFSPWPAALVLRHAPFVGGEDFQTVLDSHAPAQVESALDQSFGPDSEGATLDIFWPEDATEPLPTVVWVHGGGFIAGSKEMVRGYLKLIAARGYTVVGTSYPLAPEATYPSPVQTVSTALDFLSDNDDRWPIDTARYVLAGDSAGAHIAAQVAILISDPQYAEAIGVTSSIDASQVRAAVLVSGAFDMELLENINGIGGWMLDRALWSYTGSRTYSQDPELQYASIPAHLSPAFPPTYLTAGNADILLDHSTTLAQALTDNGVYTDQLFFAENHEPALEHEYQFFMDTPEAQLSFERMIVHLDRFTASGTGSNPLYVTATTRSPPL